MITFYKVAALVTLTVTAILSTSNHARAILMSNPVETALESETTVRPTVVSSDGNSSTIVNTEPSTIIINDSTTIPGSISTGSNTASTISGNDNATTIPGSISTGGNSVSTATDNTSTSTVTGGTVIGGTSGNVRPTVIGGNSTGKNSQSIPEPGTVVGMIAIALGGISVKRAAQNLS
jgi:hypothetical protein